MANILRDLELCPWAKRDIDVHYKREETKQLSEFTFDLQKRSDLLICLLSAKVSKRLLFSCFIGVNLV